MTAAKQKPSKPAQPPANGTSYLQRVKGLAWLPGARVIPAPKNWRTHGDHQREVLRGLLEEVGVAGAVLAWVPDAMARGKLRAIRAGNAEKFAAWLAAYAGPVQLFDGHLRREEIRQALPVLITDLDEEEARRALATFDPIGSLAGRDQALLEELLAGWKPKGDGMLDFVDELLGATKPKTPAAADRDGVGPGSDVPPPDGPPKENPRAVLVDCLDEADQRQKLAQLEEMGWPARPMTVTVEARQRGTL